MEPITMLNHFINSAIPYAWDDSESWMEFLGKVLAKVNELIKSSNQYFSVDTQTYIIALLNTWKNDGTLSNIIGPVFLEKITTLENTVAGFISVVEYGAIGDGVSDDTLSIQSALNAGAGKNGNFPI